MTETTTVRQTPKIGETLVDIVVPSGTAVAIGVNDDGTYAGEFFRGPFGDSEYVYVGDKRYRLTSIATKGYPRIAALRSLANMTDNEFKVALRTLDMLTIFLVPEELKVGDRVMTMGWFARGEIIDERYRQCGNGGGFAYVRSLEATHPLTAPPQYLFPEETSTAGIG
jgi:hypothetical protein